MIADLPAGFCVRHPGLCKRAATDPKYAAVARRRAALESGEAPLPSPVRVAANFAAATGRDVAALCARLDPEATQARLTVCLDGAGLPPEATLDGHCDRYRPSDGRCSECGCYLASVHGKAARPHESCPLGRWPGDPPAVTSALAETAPPEPGGSPDIR